MDISGLRYFILVIYLFLLSVIVYLKYTLSLPDAQDVILYVICIFRLGEGVPQVPGLKIAIGESGGAAWVNSDVTLPTTPTHSPVPGSTTKSSSLSPTIPPSTPTLPSGIQISIPVPSTRPSHSSPSIRPSFGVPVPVITSVHALSSRPPSQLPPPNLLPISNNQVDEDYDS